MRLDLNPGILIALTAFVGLLLLGMRHWQRVARRTSSHTALWSYFDVVLGAVVMLLFVIGVFLVLATGGR